MSTTPSHLAHLQDSMLSCVCGQARSSRESRGGTPVRTTFLAAGGGGGHAGTPAFRVCQKGPGQRRISGPIQLKRRHGEPGCEGLPRSM